MDLNELAVGAVLGVAASLASWLFVAHLLRPRVDVSEFISLTPGPEYRLKIQNRRRWRAAIDLELAAYVWLPKVLRPTSNERINLIVESEDVIGLAPGHRKTIVLKVDPDALESVSHLRPVEDLRTIEDILDLAPVSASSREEPEVRFWLSYADGYSGVRRATFHRYAKASILTRVFALDSVGPGAPSGCDPVDPDKQEQQGTD